MMAQRARIIRERKEKTRKRREELGAKAAAEAHAAAVAHAAALANQTDEEPVPSEVDKEEDGGSPWGSNA